MTPRLTSSNRKLRTAAIATLVAVSTAVTGVAPAFAADKTTATNSVNSNAHPDGSKAAGLNYDDGSKLPKGTVKSEKDLQTATDNIAKALNETYGLEYGTSKFAEVFAAFKNPAALNDTEKGALDALRPSFEAITKTLKQAAQNQADAMASVDAALAADKAAREAVANIKVSAANVSKINGLIKAVNDTNKTVVPNIPMLDTKPTPENVFSVVAGINAHQANVLHLDADRNKGDFVRRDYAKALEKLLADKATVDGLLDPYFAAQGAVFAAQKTDVIPMQMFLARSRAQVQVLRILQAEYGTAVRMIELYENDTLDPKTNTKSVKDAYTEAIEASNIDQAWAAELTRLQKADQQAADFFEGYDADEANSTNVKEDAEEKAYEAFRKSEAKANYERIVADRQWQNEIEKAQNKDRLYFNALTEISEAKKMKDARDAAEAKANALAKKLDATIAKNNDTVNKLASAAVADKANTKEVVEKLDKISNKVDAIGKKVEETPAPAPAPTPAPADTDKGDKGDNDKGDKGDNDKGDNDKGDNDKGEGKGEFPFMPIAIVGVVLAIIAALAANFPVLLAALPKI